VHKSVSTICDIPSASFSKICSFLRDSDNRRFSEYLEFCYLSRARDYERLVRNWSVAKQFLDLSDPETAHHVDIFDQYLRAEQLQLSINFELAHTQ